MKSVFPVFLLAIVFASAPCPARQTNQAAGQRTGQRTGQVEVRKGSETLVDGIAASIGKEAITIHEVRKRLAAAKNPVAQIFQGNAADSNSGFVTALDDLIAEHLLMNEARKLGLEVSERDVDQHVKGIMDQNGWGESDFKSAIKMLGYDNVKAYREHARKELLKGQVLRLKVGSTIRVTDREIDEAFKAAYHGGLKEDEVHLWHIVFRIPQQVTLPQIRDMIARAKRVRGMIVSGEKTFEEAAREFSEDGTGQRGGDVGFFGHGKLQPSLEEAAFALKVGEISPVVQSSVGFHILRVTKRRVVDLKDPDEARARIRYQLTEAAFQTALKSYLEGLRAAAHVEVRDIPGQ
ncbi:MAG: hypothetical protein GXP54_08970 [Deltaproteobacteria bacterium]|nr:hypothetical protein [Deltaproteobacteria bacterium]